MKEGRIIMPILKERKLKHEDVISGAVAEPELKLRSPRPLSRARLYLEGVGRQRDCIEMVM